MIDVTVIACIWPWWGYLYHGYWQTLHLGSPSTTTPTWVILVPHTYHHTTACANLYYIKRTVVSWLSTGVYVCEYTLESPEELGLPDSCLPEFL